MNAAILTRPLVLALLVYSTLVSAGAALTSFTYQGRLFEGTNAATGLYDLKFTLHDSASGGGSFGSPFITNAVPVTNGLFTVYLDFGAVFDGSPCWLEVAERTNGLGSFVILAPRQFLTIVPQSAYATTAGKALSAAPGAIDAQAIAAGAVGANQLAPGAAAANLLAGGQSGVASGGIILSGNDSNSDLLTAGYIKIGRVDLLEEKWTQYTNGPADSGPLSQPRSGALAVWTGSEMLLWGGMTDPARGWEIARFNPALDSWSTYSPKGVRMPDLPWGMVWTGNEALIWGATTNLLDLSMVTCGVRYNPVTGSLTNISKLNGPEARRDSVGVWCGNEFFVWVASGLDTEHPLLGAHFAPGYGCRYNPITDTWRSVITNNSPLLAANPSAVWSGSEVLIWGGYTVTVWPGPLGNDFVDLPMNTGARYNPQTDQWRPMSTLNAPKARYRAPAVWTGSNMLVWGGRWNDVGTNIWVPTEAHLTVLASGGRYDPVLDQWKPISTNSAPSAREALALTWAGDRMLIWGGNHDGTAEGNGAAYNPVSDVWTPLPTTGAPSPRWGQSAVWTGSEMLIWGGENPTGVPRYPNLGARFKPAQNAWRSIEIAAEPGARRRAAGVWTGSELLIWGGDSGERLLRSGARFTPALNTWRPIALSGGPSARVDHTALWTGSEMLIWGGSDGTALGTGARYKPVTDTWSPISSTGAPVARTNHTAVWSGSEMLVWGGQSAGFLADGGRYNPATDNWRPITATDEPFSRADHSAVWTGTEMIIWGGKRMVLIRPSPPLWSLVWNTDGARYNPTTDTWTPTSIPDELEPRSGHAAVWTGKEMIIYGGTNLSSSPLSGWRYAPATNSWTRMSTNGAPEFVRDADTLATDGTQVMVLKAGANVQRYLPHLDTWTPLPSTSPAPSRTDYLAVWTGTEVLVWGGVKTGTPWTLTTDIYSYRPPIKAYLYLKP